MAHARDLDGSPAAGVGIDAALRAQLGDVPVFAGDVRADDGARLSYKVFGDRGRPIALLNGLGGTYRTFGDILGLLARDHRLVTFDYRGMFESEDAGPAREHVVARHADDLFAVLDAAGVRRAVLLGWSMGVQVALEAWRSAPERVEALVLVAGVSGRLLDGVGIVPGAHLAAPRFSRWMQRRGGPVSALAAATIRSAPLRAVARRLHLVGRNADITLEHAATLLRADPARYWSLALSLQSHDATSLLPAIDVPTLILHGDRDALIPLATARAIHAAIPGAELRVLDDCTHAVVLEHPVQVVSELRGFLERRLPPAESV